MFHKNILMVGLCVSLLAVASCLGPNAESSKVTAEITKDEQTIEVAVKPKEELSKNEKRHQAKARLRQDEAYKKLNEGSRMIYADGALPKKAKQLIAIAISITSGCQPCMQGHVFGAHRDGATKEEVFETIKLGIEMSSKPTAISALPAIEKMQDVYFESSKSQATTNDEKSDESQAELAEDEVYRKLGELADMINADGGLSKKDKELIALGISVTSNSKPGMETHIKKAAEYGAMEEEVFEAIMVAVDMGGGPAGVYAITAVEKMQEIYED